MSDEPVSPKLLPAAEDATPVLALPPHEEDPKGDSAKANDAKDEKGHAPEKKSTLLVWLGIGLVALASIVVVILVVVHRHGAEKTRRDREGDVAKGPRLTVAKVEVSRAAREISLPGEVRGFNQATLYGKVSGYVGEIRVDRGDHVKKGEVIAVMESPEMIDDVILAQANAETTERNSERFTFGMQQGTVTQIDTDNALSTARQAKATLQRAKNLLGYTEVRAPFDGVVTARYVDPGALVPAATSTTQQAQPVVDIADVDRVRVFFYLGQDAATFVKVGDRANLYEDERPGALVPATVTRVSGALDPRTRTMQCEIDLDNGPWHLIPGTFVHVRLAVEIPPSPVVPDDALVTREGTTHVAIVGGDGHVHYQAIEVGTDDGRTMRVQSGLKGGETIGVNVPVEIEEGMLVQPMEKKVEGGKPDTVKSDPAPTTQATSEAPPAGKGPGPAEHSPEPNVTPDNAPDGGVDTKNKGSGSGGAH